MKLFPDALRSVAAIALAAALLACAAPHPSAPPPAPAPTLEAAMNAIAEAYVKLVLELGERDANYVDAYYGPREWRDEAAARGRSLAELRGEAHALVARLDAQDVSAAEEIVGLRRSYLRRQLEALASRTEMLEGKQLAFDEESRALYDAVAPHHRAADFEAILAELDALLPGTGERPQRIDRLRQAFVIPPARLEAVFSAAIAECRRRTQLHVALPARERFTVEYVTGKPWSAYNWYQGNDTSVIQVNTELPVTLDRAIDLACHEGYPGHHVYNLSLEEALVRGRGWQEYTVYPLFSPQSLIAEGTANFGIEVAFPGEERVAFETPSSPGSPASTPHGSATTPACSARSRNSPTPATRRRGATSTARSTPAPPPTGSSATPCTSPRARAEQRVRFFDTYRSLRHQLQPRPGPGAPLRRGARRHRREPRAPLASLRRPPRLPAPARGPRKSVTRRLDSLRAMVIRARGSRRTLALLSLLALACAGRPQAPTPPPVAAAAAPVVVTIVIDQFAGWIAAERLPLLPAAGGFARLRREGTWVVDMRYAHAATETAPGHAALYTGRLPRDNGIYTNDLPDGAESVALVRDESTRLVAAGGVTDRAGVSVARLRVPTLADALRAARPGAKVVSLSLKDRGTIFGGGRQPDAALWFDSKRDVFVTSTAFADRFPAWAEPLTNAASLAARRATPWIALADGGLGAGRATDDDAPGEGDYQALGTVFPHDFSRPKKLGDAFRLSPASDALLLDLAFAAIDAERDPTRAMLLAISLSANDYVGHVFGPDSREAWDELERLDGELARFMAGLDDRFGTYGWSLVLAADHGANSTPELPASARAWCAAAAPDAYQRACVGGRVVEKALAAALREVAAQTLGPGDWLQGVEGPWIFLSQAALAAPAELRSDLVDALGERLAAAPGVERVLALETYAASPCPAGESVEALVCNGAVLDDGAALYAVLRPGWAFDTSLTPGRGANHGGVYLYDRSVPLLVRAPGRVPAGAVEREPISFATFSRTAAALLGIPAPAGEAGADLTRR